MEEWEKPVSSEDFAKEDTEGWKKLDYLLCVGERYEEREGLMREKGLKQNTVSRQIIVDSRTDAAANEKQENLKGGPKSKQPDREIPQDVKNKIINGLGGDKILFVCEKPLTKSDCDKNEHHLMMTEKMISWSPLFLSDDEKELLKTRDEKNKLNKIQVELLEPTLTTCELELGRWEMKKPGKSSSVTFVLSHGWNDVVKRNGLKAGDHVEVWSFRRGSQLCLALITKRN
ncbi:B3 domain-containing protein At2g32645-like [Punica granatum]|nr:B3 domain-containing protein At2g32645-like [Punica granatum]